MGGQDQITQIVDLIRERLKGCRGEIGIETGMACYLTEGNLTQYEVT